MRLPHLIEHMTNKEITTFHEDTFSSGNLMNISLTSKKLPREENMSIILFAIVMPDNKPF